LPRNVPAYLPATRINYWIHHHFENSYCFFHFFQR
jgi:hypothetical protein